MKLLVMLILVLAGLVMQEGKAQGLPAQWGWADFYSVVAPASDGGFYHAQEIFQPDTINGQIFTPHGDTISSGYFKGDIMLTRYNSLNQVLWVKQIGGDGWDRITDLKASASGEVTIAFSYDDTLNLGAGQVLPGGGTQDLLFARYDSTGGVLWNTKLATSGNEQTEQLILAANGGLYQVLRISNGPSTVSIGPDTFQTSQGSLRIVSFLNSTGQWQWSKQTKSLTGNLNQLGTDAQSNCYLSNRVNQDTFQIGTFQYPNTFRSLVVVKITSAGVTEWVNQFPGYFPLPLSITTKPSGESILMVSFAQWLTVGTQTFINASASCWITLDSAGQVFSAVVDTTLISQQLAVSPTGELYLAGYFTDSLVFQNKVLIRDPGIHFNVCRLGDTDTLVWVHELNNSNGGVGINSLQIGYANDVFIEGFTPDELIIDSILYAPQQVASSTKFSARLLLFSSLMSASEQLSVFETGMYVFPNPATGSATIRFNNSDITSFVIRITDSMGRMVQQKYSDNGSISLDGLSAGLYVVEAQSGNQHWHQKLMIE